jgi:glycosyltransferase involved in cell wall biosynthesis
MTINSISACIVVHNEEPLIRRCLASVAPVVDEIVVVHDGECSDRTLDICREFTDRIHVREHIGEAEPHRVFTFEQAKGEWIVIVDADEFLSVEAQRSLRRLVADDRVDAYSFVWPVYDGERYITSRFPRKCCVFRKANMSFVGMPHEWPKVRGAVRRTDLVLHHKPNYNNHTLGAFRRKWMRWAAIRAQYVLKDFRDAPKFQVSQTDWPRRTLFGRRYPLIYGAGAAFHRLWMNYLGGFWQEGFAGLKISLLLGLDVFFWWWYLWRLKRKRGEFSEREPATSTR